MMKFRGELLVFGAAFFFATTGVLGKLIFSGGITALRLVQIRITGAFLILLLLTLIFDRKSLIVKKTEIANLILVGIVGFAAVQSLYFFAITRMPISITLVIEFTAPIWIALFIRFFKHQIIRPLMWWGILTALAGLILVLQIWDGLKFDTVGVIATFIDALCLAFYYMRSEKLVKTTSGLSLLVYAFGSAAIFLALFLPLWEFPTEILSTAIPLQEFSSHDILMGWQLIGILIIFGTVVPYLFISYGLKYIPASQGSVIAMSEPVVAGGIAWFVLGESLTVIQLFGGLVVLFGIYLTERARQEGHK